MNTDASPPENSNALSRRSFLKNSSLAAAGAAAVSNFPFVLTTYAAPVEYEYPNGVRTFSQCRQMDRCGGKVEEAIVGLKGSSNCKDWIRITGGQSWRFRDADVNPYQQEHTDLINSIRAGQPINEAQAIAESTLTGIMGRESAYSGQSVEWEQALNSKTRLGPQQYDFGKVPFPEVPIPGQYQYS
jgi:hypothetical protein